MHRLKTESAKVGFLRLLYMHGSQSAGFQLLRLVESSSDCKNLANGSEVALRMGRVGKAKRLLIKACEQAIVQEDHGHLNDYLQRLIKLDHDAARPIAIRAIRAGSATLNANERYYLAALCRPSGETPKSIKKFRNSILQLLINSEYLRDEDILRVVEIMKLLDLRPQARLFALDYLVESLGDTHEVGTANELFMTIALNRLSDRQKTLLRISVEAGLGRRLISRALKSARNSKADVEERNHCLLVADYLARITDTKLNGISRIYQTLAKRYEAKGDYSQARWCYEHSTGLDEETSERLAAAEIRRLTEKLSRKTALDYESQWNQIGYMGSVPKKPVLVGSAAYDAGLFFEIMWITDLLKEVGSVHLRERLALDATRELEKVGLYSQAAILAEHLRTRNVAESLWDKAASANDMEGRRMQLSLLRSAILHLDGGSDLCYSLLVRFIESIQCAKGEDVDGDMLSCAAEKISRKFFEMHRSQCAYLIQRLREENCYDSIIALLHRVGASDQEISSMFGAHDVNALQEVLIQLETSGSFFQAAVAAKAMNDHVLATVYSMLGTFDDAHFRSLMSTDSIDSKNDT